MAPKSLQIAVLVIALLTQPVITTASIASSTNYTLEIQDFTGTAGDASSPSYTVTAITDDNFEASTDDYNLCGGLPEEAFGDCGEPPAPPSPPPAGDTGGGSNEAIEYPEEPEPEEIPDETPSQVITFPEEDFVPEPEEPIEPQEPVTPPTPVAPARPSAPEQTVPVPTPAPSTPEAVTPGDHWINEIPDEAIPPYRPSAYEPSYVTPGSYIGEGCYGDPKELQLRPSAPTPSVYYNQRMINCLLAIILLIIAVLLLRYAFYLIDEDESKPEAKLQIWLHKVKKKFFKLIRSK